MRPNLFSKTTSCLFILSYREINQAQPGYRVIPRADKMAMLFALDEQVVGTDEIDMQYTIMK